ncbi:MAG TPA: DUF3096 domain-containing protein [Candidatus Nanoarchaeia archaeon]|nr:DUF3096 domain-containing protein [Candidatus Nanoarchaeia archaeon]
MAYSIIASAVISLVFGLLILIFPKALNYMVAFYLIIVGLIGIFSAL